MIIVATLSVELLIIYGLCQYKPLHLHGFPDKKRAESGPLLAALMHV